MVLPPGAAGNVHPVRALQVGAATSCAPSGRRGASFGPPMLQARLQAFLTSGNGSALAGRALHHVRTPSLGSRAVSAGWRDVVRTCRRHLLYLSTVASGAGAARDLGPALGALADCSALEQRQGSASAAGGPPSSGAASQQRPRALLAVYYDRV